MKDKNTLRDYVAWSGVATGLGLLLYEIDIVTHWEVIIKGLGVVFLFVWILASMVYLLIKSDKSDSVL